MKVFVAKQPIFNEHVEIFAYELLYRGNEENFFPDVNGDQATVDVIINSFLNIGIEELSSGKPCFINFTERLLQMKIPTFFSSREIIVEILDSAEPSEELIQICKELKELGYQIALDDFIFYDDNSFTVELLRYADFIKVDFRLTDKGMRERIERAAKKRDIKLVAEKIEKKEELIEAKKRGYHYFQGYLLAEPEIISAYDIPGCCQSYYEIIYHLSKNEPNIDMITELIEKDISLSYKLLKLLNSPGNRQRQRQKINSIRQAVILLGLMEIKKWISVLAVREKQDEDSELAIEKFRVCLTRAKMCESIARLSTNSLAPSAFFMAGMLSSMNSIIGVPIEQILEDIPVEEEIVDAIRGTENSIKKVMNLVDAVEKAQWSAISAQCKELGINEKAVFKIYAEAISSCNNLVSMESAL